MQASKTAEKDTSLIESVKDLVFRLELQELLAQLVYLHVRIAVGGITPTEFITYHEISDKFIAAVNKSKSKIADDETHSFHIKFTGVFNDFKKRHMALIMESITSDYYVDFFGAKAAQAINRQDELMLCKILAENLPKSYGVTSIILLEGDINKDVAFLEELSNLLLVRTMSEIASSQTDRIKIYESNPWQRMLNDEADDIPNINHIVVSYIDNTEDRSLDLDLLHQLVFILGLLKETQRKANDEKAFHKIAMNKAKYDEIHSQLPKEQEVYDIDVDAILGMNGKPKAGLQAKDIDAQVTSVNTSQQQVLVDILDVNSGKKSLKIKSLLSNSFLQNKFNKEIFLSAKKKAERQAMIELKQKLSKFNKRFLLKGIEEKEQPNLDGFIAPSYAENKGSINDINTIEQILEADLNKHSDISATKFNYGFKDVVDGVLATISWQATDADTE